MIDHHRCVVTNRTRETVLSYFRGWKRKTGLLLLIVSCVLAAGWIRSVASQDTLISPSCTLVSKRGGVYLERPGSPLNGKLMLSSHDVAGLDGFFQDPYQRISWNWRFCGFAYGELKEVQQNLQTGAVQQRIVYRYYITYWPFVLMLSVASAWLLLSKSRSAKLTRPLHPQPTA